ncbi:homologous recombination OB-fold protein [Echinops telfairi]|uniref:Homologous recombination OB-fold protein n=1 Tax=Echinops telfairi TaxID=9371 RepID=A0AC55DVH9_ECHTE|nr:homologous recombination OB-fold protein [Echinops telfairi]
MACRLQKLFAVEEEFEDEDFLSAVEDAENQFADSPLVKAGCLRPASSKPQDRMPAQSTGWQMSHPMVPSETSSRPALGLRLPTSSMARAAATPPPTETAPRRPVSTFGCWAGNQRRGILTEAPKESARPGVPAPGSRPPLESRQQAAGGLEGPDHDDFDTVLANMELEGPDMELGVRHEATGALPTWQGEDPVSAKKARVAELDQPCPRGPAQAFHSRHQGYVSSQGQRPDLPVHCRAPQRPLRPGAPGNPPTPMVSTVPTQQCRLLQAAHPLQSARGPGPCSPQALLSRQPLQALGVWHGGKPGCPGPQAPQPGCPAMPSARSGFRPQAPGPSPEAPVCTPKGPHSSLVPQAALQTPMVTNHLVQLVTAASRTPQPPTRTAMRTRARRFPGPAGLLPHQHSGRNLAEIMVSTPPTPTHGALAKFRTKVGAGSQASSSEEDFGRGPWLAMKSSLGLDESDPGCFLCTYSIIMVLRKAALRQLPRNRVPRMAVMVKSLTRSTMDASVVFKDPTGEMPGTVHRVLLETRQNELRPGSVLLLKQIGVFSPSLRNHYLNVTPSNLVCIYSPDSGDGHFLKPSPPGAQDSGNDQQDMDAKSETAPDPEAGTSLEEELSEADDLDGLLSELPEDFFSGDQ